MIYLCRRPRVAHTFAEIAIELGITEAAAAQLCYRALRKLREMSGEVGEMAELVRQLDEARADAARERSRTKPCRGAYVGD